MRRKNRAGVWLRLLAVLVLVGVITTGVTYAALQSQQAVLASNTIESATAALQLSKDGASYSNNAPGYDFPNLVPGGPAMPTDTSGYPLWLKNSGSAPLNITLTLAGTPVTTGGVDLAKVSLIVTPVNGNGSLGTPQSFTIASLVTAQNGVAFGTAPMTAATTKQYKVQVQMAADAFSGSSATITGLDLVFGGTAATQ